MMMKKILKVLIAVVIFSSFSLGAFASDILQVTNFGVAEISGNSAYVNITVNFNSRKILTGGGANWELSVLPLDNVIYNTSNSTVKLPLRNLTIYTNGAANTFTQNRSILLEKNNRSKNNLSRTYQLKLDLKDAYTPGHYTTDLQFNLQSGSSFETYLYTVDFYQKDIVKYEVLSPVIVQNDWDQIDLKRKGSKVELKSSTRVSVKSNKKWKLYLARHDERTKRKPKLYFKVIGLPQGAKTDFNSYTLYDFNKPILIAQGDATLDKFGAIKSQIVELKYRISAKDNNSFIKAGNFVYDMDYELVTQE